MTIAIDWDVKHLPDPPPPPPPLQKKKKKNMYKTENKPGQDLGTYHIGEQQRL